MKMWQFTEGKQTNIKFITSSLGKVNSESKDKRLDALERPSFRTQVGSYSLSAYSPHVHSYRTVSQSTQLPQHRFHSEQNPTLNSECQNLRTNRNWLRTQVFKPCCLEPLDSGMLGVSLRGRLQAFLLLYFIKSSYILYVELL